LREEIAEHIALQTAENLRGGLSPVEARRQAMLKFGGVEAMKQDYRAERGLLFIENLLRDVRFGLRMLRKSPGFTAVAIVTLATAIGANALVFSALNSGYAADAVPAMQRRMIESVRTIPAVTAVGLANCPPLAGCGSSRASVYIDETSDLGPSNVAASAMTYQVSPEFFVAAQTPLLAGRAFTWHEDKNAPRVAVVNETFARKVIGSATDALGRYYKMSNGTRIQVVGIVKDGKYTSLTEEPQAAMFFPILQAPSSDSFLVVRSDREPQQLAGAIRGKLRELDAGLPTFIQTWPQALDFFLFGSRMATVALGVLGLLGAILSITGIFGMAAYSVSKRLRELGIRMALGARRKEILQAALGRALKLLAFGSASGLLLGILASRVLASIVYQATPRDPLVLAGVVLAMGLLGLLATWIPAQRALSIDPMILLREE
jgi:predicted permease